MYITHRAIPFKIDVYKRQQQFIGRYFQYVHYLLQCVKGGIVYPSSVSYTHLDVYKRQLLRLGR